MTPGDRVMARWSDVFNLKFSGLQIGSKMAVAPWFAPSS
jgi:hypothetical protein